MSASAIVQCPECEAKLDLKSRERVGKRVRCPRCREIFTAKLAPSQASSRESSAPRRSRPASRQEQPPRRAASSAPPRRTRPANRSGRKKKKKSTFPVVPVIAGVAGLGGLLLVGGIVVFFLRGGGEDAGVAANGNTANGNTANGNTANGGASTRPGQSTPRSRGGQLAQSRPVTEQQAIEFAEKVEQAAKTSDRRTLTRLLNYSGIIQSSIDDIDVAERSKQGFTRGASQGGAQLMGLIIQAASGDGQYECVGHQTSDGTRQVLFRMNSTEGGINYHRFDLVSKDGAAIASDMFVAMTGDYISDTVRRIFIPLAQAENRSLLDRLMGKEQLLVKHWPVIAELQKAFQSGQFRVGMQHYRRLPPELQKEKFVLVMRIQCAAAQDALGSDYAEALGDFRRAHPDSVAADLMSIDYFVLRKQYQESAAAVDRLSRFALNDPYLDVLRGGILAAGGRADEAKACLEPLLKHAAYGKEATTSYLDVTLALKDNRGTLETLLRLENEYGMQFPKSLARAPGFEGFARSPEHNEFANR